MADDHRRRIDRLRFSITALENQRAVLGDAVVDPALDALRQQITDLESHPPLRLPEERRLITILFVDVVGSTTLADRLDPEEWRDIVAHLHGTVGAIIQKHGGIVAQYLGDGLLALFGAHGSGEHDPENAIRAALDAQTAMPALDSPHPLKIRVGVHTGAVVVGDLGSETKREFTATGGAMHLAARLQSAAPPGGILISQDTYNYVRGVFTVTPQPALTVKGRPAPIQTYLVRRVKPRAFRTVRRGVAGIQTRTVGRDSEVKNLQETYLNALAQRRGAWAQLVGEAGVGKSRLLDDIRDWIELRPEVVRVFRARAHAGDARQPFSLIRRMWLDRFQIAEDAPLAQAERKWVERFQELGKTDEVEPAHALGLLVGLSFADSPHVAGLRGDPAQVKGRAVVVSKAFLRRVREGNPLEVLLEDLQWADASSWDYLIQVFLDAEMDPALHGIFVLAAARPEWNPPAILRQSSGYRQHDLQPLSQEATRELVLELFQHVADVPEDVIRLIVERSEGIPYFTEEIVNWFVDRGIIDRTGEPWRFIPSRLKETPLPATLQHLLLTRLSALTDVERSVLQRGAIFGRNFWRGGLVALGVPEPEAILQSLQPRGFVDGQPESSFQGEKEWSFHHALLRDVTYESVLRRERAPWHRAAGAWLQEQAGGAGRLDEFAGLLGEHAERAGDATGAADWYLRAGGRAKAQGATEEARKFFGRALELLPPHDRERRWRILLGREEVLGILGEPDAWRADIAGLLELAKGLEDEHRLAEVYLRQAEYAQRTADYRAGLRAAEEAVAAARRAGDPRIEVQALGLKAQGETRLGQMETAARSATEALARSEEVGDERAAALTLNRVAVFYVESGQIMQAQRLFRRHVELDHRLGNRRAEAGGLNSLGYTYLQLGLYKLGRNTLQQALELADAIGARRPRAYILQNLGLAYFRIGDGRTARQILNRSLLDMAAVNDRWGRAATLVYLGHVLEQSGDVPGAARRYEESKEIFTDIGAPAAAIDPWAGLARCALAQGHLEEAHRHATEIWGYVTEHGTEGTEAPGWIYLTCAEVFDALNAPAEADAVIEGGHRELLERAEKIDEPEWRTSFLENVPEHHAMIEAWEHLMGERG